MAGSINETLSGLFPHESGIRFISEPGRFFVDGALSMAICIIGKRMSESGN